MRANYELSESAKADLRVIYIYGVRTFGVERADAYYNDLFDCFELIAGQALMHQIAAKTDIEYRRAVCGGEQIYYRITDDGVEIMRVLGRQDIGGRL